MNWRKLFEDSLPPPAEREYGEQYQFGRPASAKQLAAAEQALGVKLPAAVREMLSQFNGVSYTTTTGRERKYEPDVYFLDTARMTEGVPRHLADYDPVPPRYALRQVVFVAQSNGYGDLWGVVAADLPRLPAGTVVYLDHEVGRLEPRQPSLAAFVRGGLFGKDPALVKRLTPRTRPASALAWFARRRKRPSFAHWADTVPPDLIALSEDAIRQVIDRLVAFGPKPTKRQVRAAIDRGIKRFDELQWLPGTPWIDLREQRDAREVLHELIEWAGFEASNEWTDVRDW